MAPACATRLPLLLLSLWLLRLPLCSQATSVRRGAFANAHLDGSAEKTHTHDGSAVNVGDDHLRVLIVGDWGETSDLLKKVASGLERVARDTSPHFVAGVGDNRYQDGVQSEADLVQNWLDPFITGRESMRAPWFHVLGNHDWRSDPKFQIGFAASAAADGLFRLPALWYKQAFHFGDLQAEFFFVDTMVWRGSADTDFYYGRPVDDLIEEQTRWLNSSLAASQGDWKVVVGHHCLYTTGGKHPSEALSLFYLVRLDQMLREHGVVLYLNGHNHNQELFQYKGVNYITSGNAAKSRCSRSYWWHHIPMDASSDNSKFFDCTGGFAALTLTGADDAELIFYDADGKPLDRGSFTLRKTRSQLPIEPLAMHARAACGDTVLRWGVDEVCDNSCHVVADLPTGSTCRDLCNRGGHECASAGIRDVRPCTATKATPAGCDVRADNAVGSLICNCAPRSPTVSTALVTLPQ